MTRPPGSEDGDRIAVNFSTDTGRVAMHVLHADNDPAFLSTLLSTERGDAGDRRGGKSDKESILSVVAAAIGVDVDRGYNDAVRPRDCWLTDLLPSTAANVHNDLVDDLADDLG